MLTRKILSQRELLRRVSFYWEKLCKGSIILRVLPETVKLLET